MQPTSTIYRLRVTLEGIAPPIWRSVEVPADLMVQQLHRVIQAAMGWRNSHLHQFEELPWTRAAARRPARLIPQTSRLWYAMHRSGKAFVYVYDFGDDWRHLIELDAVVQPEPIATYPRCVAGARACPPEDCGGVPGYEALLTAMQHPDDPEADELLAWAGGFDPEAFDLIAANAALARVARRSAVALS